VACGWRAGPSCAPRRGVFCLRVFLDSAYPGIIEAFTNASADIRAVFCRACDSLGIEWRQMNARSISAARRASVEMLDSFVGPKA
jgi:hypothetical protein